jgi:hypothetical protein
MTRFEKMTVVLSATALVVSLAAATLAPYVTYKWFDPAQKEQREERERGILQHVRTESIGKCNSYDKEWGALIEDPMFVVVTLVNVGKRPMKDVMVSVEHEPRPSDGLKVDIPDGFVLVRQNGSKETSLFLISPAIPAGTTIGLRVSGKFTKITINPQSGSDPDLPVFDRRDFPSCDDDFVKGMAKK